jgi:hypothetical protein
VFRTERKNGVCIVPPLLEVLKMAVILRRIAILGFGPTVLKNCNRDAIASSKFPDKSAAKRGHL